MEDSEPKSPQSIEYKSYPNAWAKLSDGKVLPLEDHASDVAAVMQALLELGWQKRLEGILKSQLSEFEHATLLALAFLHDLGKCNRGFWGRQFPNAPIIGHTAIVLVLQEMNDPWPRLANLETICESAGTDLLLATLAHHGAPICPLPTGMGHSNWWKVDKRYDPIEELACLLRAAAERFPCAISGDVSTIIMRPRAISLYAGLLTLADWIGSDVETFPIDGLTGTERAKRSKAVARERVQALGLGTFKYLPSHPKHSSFEHSFDVPAPYEMQALCGKNEYGSLVILEAETGSGKTEAALWRFLNLLSEGVVDGLYFALPTRTSAVQMHSRVQQCLDLTFGDHAPQAVLAVPGYLRAGYAEGTFVSRFDALWPDDLRDRVEDATWSAEAPKRYLAARVAIGTVDQAMLSGLRTRHAHLRATTLSRSLLVVDEVHASDPFMTEVLARVIDNHRQAGGHALLLSATLGAAARTRYQFGSGATLPSIEAACGTPYPALHDANGIIHNAASGERNKDIAITLSPHLDDPVKIAHIALEAAKQGARVLVIRNTVDGAVATLQALEALQTQDDVSLFSINGEATLHHGRFAADDRRLLDREIESAFGKNKSTKLTSGMIGIGTQTLEMSLDLDADFMLTDLAPMDVLLQRFGRLHRHRRDGRPASYVTPKAIVLVPAVRDLTPYLGRVSKRHGIGPMRDGQGVYANLPAIEATWRQLEEHCHLDIPRQNRRLVELTTHPDVWATIENELDWLNAGIERVGVLINDRRLANEHGLDLGIPFSELAPFPADDEAVRTRIGASGRLVEFAPALPGPFGNPITSLQIPAWMLRGESIAEPIEPISFSGGFEFKVGERHFLYDRFGLRRNNI